MKLPTTYVPIFHRNEKHQMLSTKRIKSITDLLPTKEEIEAHLMVEIKLVKETKGYEPQPYIISVDKEKYGQIQNDLKKKITGYKSDVVYLMFTSESAPIIKIVNEN